MATAERVLDALGDSTRRRVLELVRDGPISVGEIAEQLPVSRPAVSKHLRVLGESGLVTHVRVGTRSLYRIDARGLTALRDYLDELWTDVLDAFATHVAAEHAPPDPAAEPATGPPALLAGAAPPPPTSPPPTSLPERPGHQISTSPSQESS